MHVTADIGNALARYTEVTGDVSVEVQGGLELLAETARLWMSLGNFGRDGKWHIAGVTGPDEYTALVDDNVYTNLAAAHNLVAAADAAERHLDLSAQFGIASSEIAAWRSAAAAAAVPYNEQLRVHEQNFGFTMLPEWDFEANKDKYPLLLHVPYFELYRRQVIKQADLELAMCMYGSAFSPDDKARNVDYYEQRTVRDSSLSANVQAVICAEVGHLELAYDYASEAAFIDLHDIHHNTRDGLHMASLAGAWVALVVGFGGVRDEGGQLRLTPRLPEAIDRMCLNIRWRGLKLKVDISQQEATYSLRDGADATLTLYHEGNELTLQAGAPASRPITPFTPLLSRPKQPPGREPLARPLAGHS
jgi:alpha,alpha-trehalose phosphorylase